MKYYLVSYNIQKGTAMGFGNTFFEAEPYLDIRKAEKEISAKGGHALIIAINEISKEQYDWSNTNQE